MKQGVKLFSALLLVAISLTALNVQALNIKASEENKKANFDIKKDIMITSASSLLKDYYKGLYDVDTDVEYIKTSRLLTAEKGKEFDVYEFYVKDRIHTFKSNTFVVYTAGAVPGTSYLWIDERYLSKVKEYEMYQAVEKVIKESGYKTDFFGSYIEVDKDMYMSTKNISIKEANVQVRLDPKEHYDAKKVLLDLKPRLEKEVGELDFVAVFNNYNYPANGMVRYAINKGSDIIEENYFTAEVNDNSKSEKQNEPIQNSEIEINKKRLEEIQTTLEMREGANK